MPNHNRFRLQCWIPLALAAGLLAYFIAGKLAGHHARQGILLDNLDELSWLKKELSLSPDQFARVADLHQAYRPKCARMCRQIAAADANLLHTAASSRSSSPELRTAIHHAATVRAACLEAMIGHLHETAATLDPEQARRFLEAMLPLALNSPSRPAAHDGH